MTGPGTPVAERGKDPLAEHPLGGESGTGAAHAEPQRGLDDVALAPLAAGTPQAPPAARAETREPKEPEPDLPEEAPAGSVAFGRRAAAGLADLVILGLFGAVELAAGALLLELRFPPEALVGLGAFLLLAAFVLLVLVPFVWGTTPGMALADLRISAPDGGSPTLAAAFLRFVGFLLTGLLAGVPLLVAAFDRRGRTLADLISGTLLVPAR